MSKQSLGAPVLAAALIAAWPVVAHGQTFEAKPGAWENSVTTSGLAIPPEVLAKMPPERRAMVEQQLSANGGQTRVHQACVTKEDMEKDFVQRSNSSCTVETVSRTSTKLLMKTTCTAPVASTGTMSWEAKSPESVVGNIDQDAGGRKIHINIIGKWLGASCEGIPPRTHGGG